MHTVVRVVTCKRGVSGRRLLAMGGRWQLSRKLRQFESVEGRGSVGGKGQLEAGERSERRGRWSGEWASARMGQWEDCGTERE